MGSFWIWQNSISYNYINLTFAVIFDLAWKKKKKKGGGGGGQTV